MATTIQSITPSALRRHVITVSHDFEGKLNPDALARRRPTDQTAHGLAVISRKTGVNVVYKKVRKTLAVEDAPDGLICYS